MEEKYTEHEAALFVSYLVYVGMTKAGFNKAAEVKERIQIAQMEWIAQGFVDPDVAANFSTRVSRDVADAQPDVSIGFNKNAPNLEGSDPRRSHTAGQYFLVLLEDLLPISAVEGLTFPYVLAVIDRRTGEPELFVTLERSLVGHFLGVFSRAGGHKNYGQSSDLDSLDAFEVASIDLACQELDIDKSAVVRISG